MDGKIFYILKALWDTIDFLFSMFGTMYNFVIYGIFYIIFHYKCNTIHKFIYNILACSTQ